MGLRVYELAKEFGLDSKKVVEVLKDKGEDVKSHLSSVDADIGRKLIQESVSNVIEGVIEGVIEDVVEVVEEKVDDIVEQGKEVIEESVAEVKETVVETFDTITEEVQETVDEVVERVEAVVPDAEIIEQKLGEVKDKIRGSQKPRGFLGWILSLFGYK